MLNARKSCRASRAARRTFLPSPRSAEGRLRRRGDGAHEATADSRTDGTRSPPRSACEAAPRAAPTRRRRSPRARPRGAEGVETRVRLAQSDVDRPFSRMREKSPGYDPGVGAPKARPDEGPANRSAMMTVPLTPTLSRIARRKTGVLPDALCGRG